MTQHSALDGLRVLDFSHALAGPYCTLLLADYGAEVYKLEAPGHGDMGRGWGPPFVGEQAAFFVGLNRGKRALSIDLKKPEGLALCRKLVERVDILIENFRPGTMDRLGLGYEALSALQPGLIYCSISGYGQNGPSREEAAMDLIVECSSGYISITGTEAGDQVRSGYSLADINAGMFALIGILMALEARHRTGRGQYIDVSMQDAMISVMTSNFMTYLGGGALPKPMGTSFATVVPYRVFEASDRKRFSIAAGSEKLWRTLCSAIGRPELAAHPDYSSNPARVRNRPALESDLQSTFANKTLDEWIEILRTAGIPCSPVRDFAEVVADPQSAVRQMFPEVERANTPRQRVTGPPVKLSATPGFVRGHAPEVGEHSAETLSKLLGLAPAEIAALVERGIVVQAETA